MPKIFLAGSIKVKNLHQKFTERLSKIVSDQMDVIIGDANGADSAIQRELFERSAHNVTIYCTDEKPRNNFGNWRFKRVATTAPTGTRAYFTAKDIAMAADADFGLMIWDKASTGTLSNVFELIKNHKKCVIYLNKDQEFVNVKEPNDIHKLINSMSERAMLQAERKINLQSKLFELTNEQLNMPI